MVNRIITIGKTNSFFLFGPRGTGKSTLLKTLFASKRTLWIDLLNPDVEDQYSREPGLLRKKLESTYRDLDWVIIDEVQKFPRLLDTVHSAIETWHVKFALTGSSARKLRHGAANLLAGRAFVNNLFPLTARELGDRFDLTTALQWGTLPKMTELDSGEDRTAFLRTYTLTYLKEEIWAEHIIRKLNPFRKFLEVAAQSNGHILNFSNIADDIGVDTVTVQSYFQILDDTLVGFLLEPYHRSLRKRQRTNPKFYFFDTGVCRALEGTLAQSLLPQTTAFGRAFEHFVILEAHRLNDYLRKDYRFSFLRTKDDAEIDLIIDRPGGPPAFVEIKSTERVTERDIHPLEQFLKDEPKAEGFVWSRDPHSRKFDRVHALPWQEGFKAVGLV